MTLEELQALKRGYSTRKEFAEALGVSAGTVARWEAGAGPSARMEKRLREFSGVQQDREKEIEKLKNEASYWRTKYINSFFKNDSSDEPSRLFHSLLKRLHPDTRQAELISCDEVLLDLIELASVYRASNNRG